MSPNQMMALKALGECSSEEFGYLNFASIHRRSGLDRHLVRTDEGELAGAGYRITAAGRAALAEKDS